MSAHVDVPPVAAAVQAEPADVAAEQGAVPDQGRPHGAGVLRPPAAGGQNSKIPGQANNHMDRQPLDMTLFFSKVKRANIDLSVLYYISVKSLSYPCV